jgi:rhomboid protease GluP
VALFQRKTTGSVVCPSCGLLVGVADDRCYNCGRRNPGMWGFTPLLRQLGADFGFVPIVIWGCAALYFATLAFSGGNIGMNGLFGLLGPSGTSLFIFGASGAIPVFGLGRWWTIFSASWLHGGALHIFFNMLWVRQLGPAAADIFGPGRMVIIYVIGGACGFLLSSIGGAYVPIPFLSGAQFTVGASAPIFALLGALVHYGQRSGSSIVRREALYYAGMMFVFGLVMRGVDNYSHAGGFLGGYVVSMFLDPLKRERGEHLIWAAVCIGVSVLAIIVSLATGIPLMTAP